MKYIIIVAILAVFLAPCAASASIVHKVDEAASADNKKIEQPIKNKQKNKRKRRPMPITPGSQVIIFKNNVKAEIRPDKSVWWFGVNHKKAIVADGKHELKDGQFIETKGGTLVSKPPKPSPEPQKKRS